MGNIDQHLAARLAEARQLGGISVDAAAQAIEKSAAEYEAIERGEVRIAALVVAKLGRLFGKPVSWFYQGLPGQAVFDVKNGAQSV